MIASPHALATAAGVDVLRRGGNAVDAAIATNAVLAVVYPASCGIGGDALWLVYEPKTNETIAYNGSGRAPAALEAALVREQGFARMPARSAFTVTTPGCVRSWEDVARAHGTRALDELLLPAERYARDGFVATDVNAHFFALNDALLRADPDAAALLARGGLPLAGDIVRNEALADSLAAIRRGGANAFYGGAIAEAICSTLNALGNPMTPDDLAAQTTERMKPIAVPWHGATSPRPSAELAGCRRADRSRYARERRRARRSRMDASRDRSAQARVRHSRDARFADPAAMERPIDDLLGPRRSRRCALASIPSAREGARPARSRRYDCDRRRRRRRARRLAHREPLSELRHRDRRARHRNLLTESRRVFLARGGSPQRLARPQAAAAHALARGCCCATAAPNSSTARWAATASRKRTCS
jgi:gamma-glutamyltranspeptidase